MTRDPIVDEVRRTREQILARFGGDLGKYIAYLRRKQMEHPERLISPEELRARHTSAEGPVKR